MRASTLAIPFLILLLTLPGASAGWFDSADVTMPTLQAGDQYRYTMTASEEVRLTETGERIGWESPVITGKSTVLIEALGVGMATDRFGVDRAVNSYRVKHAQDDRLVRDEACHQLQNSGVAVRRDVFESDPDYSWRTESSAFAPVYSGSFEKDFTPVVSFDYATCPGQHPWVGGKFSEGDTVSIWSPALVPGLATTGYAESRPGVATTFHGRNALAFAFDASRFVRDTTGTVTFVLADGLSAIARIDVDITRDHSYAKHHIVATTELVGFLPGVGPAIDPTGNAQLPTKSPLASFESFDGRHFDDSAFGFPYTFDEALASVTTDRSTGMPAFLESHPAAVMTAAIYERQMRAVGTAPAHETQQGDGGWFFIFADSGASHAVTSVRTTGISSPAGALASPTKLTQNTDVAGYDRISAPQSLPAARATSATLARLLADEGLPTEDIESLVYFVTDNGRGGAHVTLFVAEVPYMFGIEGGDEGRFITLDPLAGSVENVRTSERRTRTSLVGNDLGGSTGGVSERSALAGMPESGSGLAIAATAVTGLALLLLVVKFAILPFFTRLKRDALLDNPVRARLHERVRADPGIHLADLVDFAAIGYGATRHHLEQLVKHRYLSQLNIDGMSRYYAAGEVPPQEARRAAILRSDSTRRVYEVRANEPALSLREAGARLGMSAPSVHRIKKKLEGEGLLPAANGVVNLRAEA